MENNGTQDAYREQLVGCFEKVFPGLSRRDILECTQSSVATWDSIAHVTLMSLVGEQFEMEVDFEDFEEATSFGAVMAMVCARKGN